MLIHLLPQLNQLHIVLASASPRRLALLQSLGLTSITVHPSTFPELLPHSSHTPSSYALATSLAKAQSTLSSLHPNSPPPDLLISADTVISLPPHIIEKPATPSHALSTLRRLSNTTHSVLTAVTLIRPRDGATLSFVEETRVTFTTLTDAAMQAYVDTGEPMDKAGGYGIQGMAAQFVRRIEGDYSNVVGLPLHALCARMEAFVQPLLAKAGGGGGGADGVAAVAALPAAVRGEGVEEERVAMLRGLVGSYPEWPVAGVLFRDIFPLFQSPTAAQTALDLFAEHITATHTTVDVIVGLEARGFLFGAAIAPRLGAAFVPIRKAGKLPGPVLSAGYEKEYGADAMQMQRGALREGQRVVIVDDLLATGGTMRGAVELCRAAGGEVLQCVVLIELLDLHGRSAVHVPVHSFIQYNGD